MRKQSGSEGLINPSLSNFMKQGAAKARRNRNTPEICLTFASAIIRIAVFGYIAVCQFLASFRC